MTLTWVLRYRWLETSFHDITLGTYNANFYTKFVCSLMMSWQEAWTLYCNAIDLMAASP